MPTEFYNFKNKKSKSRTNKKSIRNPKVQSQKIEKTPKNQKALKIRK